MVRAYIPQDYQAVYKIYRESFGPEFTERLLQDHLQTSDFVWVYETGEKVVGYLLAESTSSAAYLSQVAVASYARKCGIATSLIKSFEEHYCWTQGCDTVWLQVKVENPSQKLYFDLGYRVTKFEANLYGQGQHGLRMSKDLGALEVTA